jgi:hypothetical protein
MYSCGTHVAVKWSCKKEYKYQAIVLKIPMLKENLKYNIKDGISHHFLDNIIILLEHRNSRIK